MRSPMVTGAAVVAMLVSTAALAGAVAALRRPIPEIPEQQPLGVCVFLNDSFADTTVTATVEQATRVNGVVTCESGSYVPVTPK